VVAEIIGNDLQGDDLDEVLAELVLLDLRVSWMIANKSKTQTPRTPRTP
jgi:hypothetical protein